MVSGYLFSRCGNLLFGCEPVGDSLLVIFMLDTSCVIQHFPDQHCKILLGEWLQCKFFYAKRLGFFL